MYAVHCSFTKSQAPSDMPSAKVGLGRRSSLEVWEEVLGTGAGGAWQEFVWLVRKLFTSSQLGRFSGVTNSQPGLEHFWGGGGGIVTVFDL